jgi:hypothetical protein
MLTYAAAQAQQVHASSERMPTSAPHTQEEENSELGRGSKGVGGSRGGGVTGGVAVTGTDGSSMISKGSYRGNEGGGGVTGGGVTGGGVTGGGSGYLLLPF